MRISRLISQLSCSNFDFFVPGQRRWSIPIWTYSTGISHYWIIASPQDLEEKFLWQNSYWNQKLDFFFQNNFCKSRKTFKTILNFCFRFFPNNFSLYFTTYFLWLSAEGENVSAFYPCIRVTPLLSTLTESLYSTLSLWLFVHYSSKSDNKLFPVQFWWNLTICIFPPQLTVDLRGEGAGARDSGAGGAAGALALLSDELAGEPSQSDQHLHHGTGESG